MDDTRGELNKFKREVGDKSDIISEVNERIDKLIIDVNNRFDEIDEDFEDIENDIESLEILKDTNTVK